MLPDALRLAIKNIRTRKFRSFLTLLGIAIGITAIIALVGIGEGMERAITSELSSLSDTVLVSTAQFNLESGGNIQGLTLSFTDRDLEDMRRVDGVRDVSPILTTQGLASYNRKVAGVTVLGMDPVDMESVFGMSILGLESGDFLAEGQRSTCILGYNVAHHFFGSEVRVGDRITVNGEPFIVGGVYNKQGAGFSVPADDHIHLATEDFQRLTGLSSIHVVLVKVYDVHEAERIAEDIELYVDENHGSDDFTKAVTMASILESIQSVLAIIQVVLIGIASVALVVASIGIMNTMLTSVMERTREIGIMKAIGATNKDVLVVFLAEGSLISFLGGGCGCLLGLVGARVMGLAMTGYLGIALTPVVSPTTLGLGLGVAMAVGIASSLYPSRKAAKLSPVEAVRYE